MQTFGAKTGKTLTRHPSSYHCATTAMLKTHITHDFKPRHYILYVYFIIFIVEWKCIMCLGSGLRTHLNYISI